MQGASMLGFTLTARTHDKVVSLACYFHMCPHTPAAAPCSACLRCPPSSSHHLHKATATGEYCSW